MAHKFIFRKTKVPIPTLIYTVWVIVTSDICKAACKIRAAENPRERAFYESAGALSMHAQDQPISYILLTPNATVEHIAHEVWHVVRKMFFYVDAELENELVAYHIGYLAQHAWDILKKGKK